MNKTIVTPSDPADRARPATTQRVTRGCQRLLIDYGNAVLLEMKLANGRRADLVGLAPDGTLTIIEVKSCQADFDVDAKWPDYTDYCDQYYFAVDDKFPTHILPDTEGLIIADQFGGAIIRPHREHKLAPARRKAMLLRFARQAAFAAMRLSPESSEHPTIERAT